MRWQVAVLIGVALSIASCAEKRESLLPNVDVDFTISLTLPGYDRLNYPGGVLVYPNAGYNNNGVYIVRVSNDAFEAFDVTCTDHLDNPTATRLEGNVAKCPECKVEYHLMNHGYTSDGSRHLQEYRVYAEPGTSLIRVRN